MERRGFLHQQSCRRSRALDLRSHADGRLRGSIRSSPLAREAPGGTRLKPRGEGREQVRGHQVGPRNGGWCRRKARKTRKNTPRRHWFEPSHCVVCASLRPCRSWPPEGARGAGVEVEQEDREGREDVKTWETSETGTEAPLRFQHGPRRACPPKPWRRRAAAATSALPYPFSSVSIRG